MPSPKNSIFVYGHWKLPGRLYVIFHGQTKPPRAITKRYHYRQATLCDDPRQSSISGCRGATMDGVYITGLTGVEVGKLDQYFAPNGCIRRQVVVQMICCSGHDIVRKAFVWFPSRPVIEGFHSWNSVPSSRVSDGVNKSVRGFKPAAPQRLIDSSFGGAAFATNLVAAQGPANPTSSGAADAALTYDNSASAQNNSNDKNNNYPEWFASPATLQKGCNNL